MWDTNVPPIQVHIQGGHRKIGKMGWLSPYTLPTETSLSLPSLEKCEQSILEKDAAN